MSNTSETPEERFEKVKDDLKEALLPFVDRFKDPEFRMSLSERVHITLGCTNKKFKFLKIVDTWIEVQREREKKAVESQSYSQAATHSDYADGIEQAKLLFEQIFGGLDEG